MYLKNIWTNFQLILLKIAFTIDKIAKSVSFSLRGITKWEISEKTQFLPFLTENNEQQLICSNM